MEQLLLNIGFGNTVVADRVVAILSPNSSPMKRVKDEAKEARSLIDVTHGRKTRAIIITDSNHVILSAIQAETVSSRFEALMKEGGEAAKEPGKESGKQPVKASDKKGS
jgi:extracellular matrix regulatory protein A